jgi:uncharacterized membrane protein
VLNELRREDGPWSEILERAVAVILDSDARASVQMNVDLIKREAVGWARVWGALLNAVLFVPITTGMVEAADKVASPSTGLPADGEDDEGKEIKWWRESLKHSDNFRRDVAALISPNSSAVLMLARKINISEALKHLGSYGETIVHTTINDEQDEKLSAMLKRR